MLTVKPGMHIVQSVSELPDLRGSKVLYADAETTAFDDTTEAFHPYLGHRACGWAVTADDHTSAWYVPIRHTHKEWNLPIDAVNRWLGDQMGSCKTYSNFAGKFDAHFMSVEGITMPPEIECSQTMAKLIDSDRYSHELKPLASEWLNMPSDDQDRVLMYLNEIKLKGSRKKCQNYARVPADIMGEYACGDVHKARRLRQYCLDKRPEGQEKLWETERALTKVLFKIEQRGLRVDMRATKIEQLRSIRTMIESAERIEELVGVELVNSSTCMQEILCVQLGLPILAYNYKKGKRTGPSFDKDVLKLYLGHPRVVSNAKAQEVVSLISQFRTESQFNSLYCESFQKLVDKDGLIHPSYNQTIRTGRMSCRNPNSQQMSSRAKALIIPKKDHYFICGDASQMEFRLIVHYINDEDAIAAYAKDKRTDFHQWVANMCNMSRKGGKTMNFAVAYGAGKKRVTQQLVSSPEIMEEVGAIIDARILAGEIAPESRGAAYEAMCVERAGQIYGEYHDALPGIRYVSQKASKLCELRGFIKNAYGRRRYLPKKVAYKSFNTAVQGLAMDVIKERMVASDNERWEYAREVGIECVANVHDELLNEVPNDVPKEEACKALGDKYEDVPYPFKVPFVWDMGASDKNWKEAKDAS